MKKSVIILSSLIIILSACGSTKVNLEDSLEKNFSKGVELLEKGKFYKAIDNFTFIVFNSPGNEIADDAQLYLGDCHYGLKEYIIAVDEYNRLINRWPASELVEDARYKISESYYKLSPKYQLYQENTIQAINSFQEFVEDYPGSEHRDEAENKIKELRLKLAKKIYDTGKLYITLMEWDAAIITYSEILDSYYDTEIINETYLKVSQCYNKMGDTENSTDFLNKVDVNTLEHTADKLLYNTLKN